MTCTKNFLFIFTISETLFLCIYLFSKGFLLSKDVIEITSTCTDFSNASNSCWLPKKYDKLIFIVIDALRYDFAHYNEKVTAENKELFENNLKIIPELLKQSPYNGRLSKFIADAPTTTSQRIKGLTTGSLPTFIDAGSNFGSESIGDEDNLIDQLKKHERKIVGLGDDTWNKLFPGRFQRSHFFPSFNIMDLDTVDDGILEHLWKEIVKQDWNVLIAHFLGVDHCGHLFSSRSKQMEQKLIQMDGVIRDVVKLMDEDTLLVVAGDHGMTNNGDHGGEAEDEVTSALFVYSSKPIFSNPKTNNTSVQLPHVVDQIDMVPTLAMLLGVPIPYSNIGTVISDMFSDSMTPLLVNAKQVYRYLNKYRSINPDFSHWAAIQASYVSLMENPSVNGALHFLDYTKTACKEAWGQFNVVVMTISIWSAAILLLIYSLDMISCRFRPAKMLELFFVFNVAFLSYFCVSSLALCLIPAYLCFVAARINTSFGIRSTVPVCCFVITCLTTFSNSYVVDEHLVCNFLIASVASVQLYCRTANSSRKSMGAVQSSVLSWSCYIILLSCTRLGYVSFRCREFQKWCLNEVSFFHKSLASLPFATACFRVAISITVIFCPVLVMFKMHSKTKYNVLATFVNFVCVALYWLLLLFDFHVTILPLLSYGITLCMIIYSISKNYLNRLIFQFCSLLYKENNLFYKEQCMYNQISYHNKGDGRFATKLFDCYFIILSNVFISILLIISSGYSISVALLVVAGGCALVLHSCQAWHQNGRSPFCVQVLPILLWFFLSQQGFYITGHQMNFTTIHWPAAFVGFRGGSNLAAAILVGVDTFSSKILFGITCPLLFLAPVLLRRKLQKGVKESADYYLTQNKERMMTCLTQYCASYILVHAVKVLMTSLAALILRRHLHLWTIFGPHFIFEAIGFGVTCFSTMLGYALVASVLQSAI